ncbi:sigma-54-dependent Fis family transcriptional regulator [Alkaliphilus peptidifermentans]|uniref:Transcriptional regulator containing PAS, AAA-type ATPase, and DNA-binding Fis domains n=1 Tax=Alkaliphilus peptidifermentans DSM 18978 TaxID=1120976 RepID=A0A1G5CWR2_9FIRM|nr:sigma 54-interacting transcriptional regulator [Alkaliphilus peptidifermentans]SCY06854.1 Transcriptional regulator containing PAS, AAA-type ATPase, and DNA-binding Fis domains [Alkaliphilus peptidifermentans DSM 18978]
MQKAHMELDEYNELYQKVVEAIEAVIGLDVTIMNENMRRIAGTGLHKELIDEKIDISSAFGRCLTSGRVQVISDRFEDGSLCSSCPRATVCTEKASICVPIKQGDKPIGVLGITAFNQIHKHRIVDNWEVYVNYLEKMALLIEAKYSEHQSNIEKKKISARMTGILNTINSGVVLYDKEGKVLYKNKSLIRILREIGIEDEDEFVKEIRKNKLLQSLLDNDECAHPCEIAIDILGVKYNLLVTITYLKISGYSNEVMLTIQNINYFKKQVMQTIEKNQVRLKFENILGISPNFCEVKRLAEKAALSDSNILILGESGTGKELFARAIHNYSDRKDYAFVPINCGAIPDELFESELFGYEKGAFTGAFSNKIGKFEIADRGTVFLDEISEMPYRLQVKLLRILQEKEVSRIGSNIVHKIDIKIIAASNVDLKKRVKEGLFREDLYYRLNVIPLNIPPLRDRQDDIIFITNHYVKYYSGMLKNDIKGISQQALGLLLEYSWPGNIRELQNLVEYAVNFETSNFISKKVIEKRLLSNQDNCKTNRLHSKKSLEDCLSEVEKEIICSSIKQHSNFGNREYVIKQVCKELKISRATLYRKINNHGICLNNETSLIVET